MNLYNLLINYNNITINMGILGNWNSADFVLPNNAFVGIISLIGNGMLVLYSIFFFFRFVNMISTFDLDSITSSDDVLNFF